MKGFKMKRILISLILVCSIVAGGLTQIGCDKQKTANALVAGADVVADKCGEVRPLFQQYASLGLISQQDASRIDGQLERCQSDSKLLADAFRNGQNQSAVDIAGRVIDSFEALITNDVGLIKDPSKRTWTLALLSAADISLHFIASQMVKIAKNATAAQRFIFSWATQQTKDSADKIRAFAKKPKLRCRDAVSGRFRKMEQCKLHPESTVVERVKK
jgi:hypothetical protein